jgi:hypothetical protein
LRRASLQPNRYAASTLTRQRFFDNTTRQQLNGNGNLLAAGGCASDQAAALSPSINFVASPLRYHATVNCFPLADRKVLCADQSRRAFLFDAAGTRDVVTMPDLHKPKSVPFSLFVPSANSEDHDDGGGGSIFVMDSIPVPELRRTTRQFLSHQFEAFVYRKPTLTSFSKSWHCQLLPPPPFVCDPNMYCHDNLPRISSYTVVGGGSHICLSAGSGAGTLPFHGKV